MIERLHERVRWLTILCMLTLLPLAYWPGLNDCFPLTKLLLLVGFGSLAAMLSSRRIGGGIFMWTPFWLGVCAMGAALGSMPMTLWRSVPEAMLLALPVLVARSGIPAACLRKALHVYVGAAVLVGAVGIWQMIGGEEPGVWISPFNKGVASTIGNPDLLGGFLVFPFALALARAKAVGSGWAWKLSSLLLGAAILVTEARAAWLAGGVAALLLVRRSALRTMVLGLMGGLGVMWIVASPAARARLFSTSALEERLWTWRLSVQLVRSRPLVGYGAGAFRTAYLAEQTAARENGANYYHYTEYAHLEPLHICVEFGVLGLGVMLWGLAACLAGWRASRLKDRDPALWHGVGVGAAGVLLNGLFSFPLHVPPTAVGFWLMLCTGVRLETNRPLLPVRRPQLWLVWPATVLLLTMMLRLAYLSMALRLGQIQAQAGWLEQASATFAAARRSTPADARLNWHGGAVARRRGELTEALVWLNRGLEIDPNFAELHLERGLTLKAIGQADAAEAAYRSALQVNPLLTQAWNNLGNLLGGRNQLVEAESAQRRALELDPASREVRQNLAITLVRLGRNEEALRILQGGK